MPAPSPDSSAGPGVPCPLDFRGQNPGPGLMAADVGAVAPGLWGAASCYFCRLRAGARYRLWEEMGAFILAQKEGFSQNNPLRPSGPSILLIQIFRREQSSQWLLCTVAAGVRVPAPLLVHGGGPTGVAKQPWPAHLCQQSLGFWGHACLPSRRASAGAAAVEVTSPGLHRPRPER